MSKVFEIFDVNGGAIISLSNMNEMVILKIYGGNGYPPIRLLRLFCESTLILMFWLSG